MGIEQLHHEHMDAYILAGLTWEEYRLQPATYHVGRTTWWRRKQALLAAGQPVKTDRELVSAHKAQWPRGIEIEAGGAGERLGGIIGRDDATRWPEACKLLESTSKSALCFPSDADLDLDLPHSGERVCLLPVLASYVVAWAADLALLRRITAQLVTTPGLYLCVLGDLADLVDGMRRQLAIHGSHLPVDQRNNLVSAWLKWVAPKIAFVSGRNSSETPASPRGQGTAVVGSLSRRTLSAGPSALMGLKVGDQQYSVGVSSRLCRQSLHTALRHCLDYRGLRHAGPEALLLESTHSLAATIYSHAGPVRSVIICGTSVRPTWGRAGLPCLTFDARRHVVTCYPSLTSWVRSSSR